jgi:ribosomal protein L9
MKKKGNEKNWNQWKGKCTSLSATAVELIKKKRREKKRKEKNKKERKKERKRESKKTG